MQFGGPEAGDKLFETTQSANPFDRAIQAAEKRATEEGDASNQNIDYAPLRPFGALAISGTQHESNQKHADNADYLRQQFDHDSHGNGD
jgi:hypothetical protein